MYIATILSPSNTYFSFCNDLCFCGIARVGTFNDNDCNKYSPQKVLIEKQRIN
jgi:hypothetical protein